MALELGKSKSGLDFVVFGEGKYLSFGKEGDVKWVHVHDNGASGTFNVSCSKVPKKIKLMMGEDVFKSMKSALKDKINEKGMVPRAALPEIVKALEI